MRKSEMSQPNESEKVAGQKQIETQTAQKGIKRKGKTRRRKKKRKQEQNKPKEAKTRAKGAFYCLDLVK